MCNQENAHITAYIQLTRRATTGKGVACDFQNYMFSFEWNGTRKMKGKVFTKLYEIVNLRNLAFLYLTFFMNLESLTLNYKKKSF